MHTSSPTLGRASRSDSGREHVGIRPREHRRRPDQIDPDVVEVFGLDDLEAALSSGIFDAYQPQRAEYNRAWDEVKAAAASRLFALQPMATDTALREDVASTPRRRRWT